MHSNKKHASLILVRHGISEWNHLGLWAGLTDIALAPEGIEEARRTGASITDIEIHDIHVSKLKRAHQTLTEIIDVTGHAHLPIKAHSALNERDYGDFTGKNKWQIKKDVGEERFRQIRRSWDEPLPAGESLKDVHARVIPYFDQEILPQLKAGKNVLVVAHGNSLRALAKHLENISDEDIANLEIGTGEAHVYHIDATGTVHGKEIRASNEKKGKV
jgi:2,3-bisphosphoglycerate-dependent phosphoglycerate mutase